MTTTSQALNTARITIKSFKTVKWMSEETICFTASVLIDGKVIGEASNEGHGGSTFVRFIGDARQIWNSHSDVITDYVDTLADAEVNKKEIARIVAKIRRDAIKKVQYLKMTTQKGFVAGFKNITDVNRAKAVEIAKASPDFKTMVADMTDAEISAWFIV
jgi:hypothetical protein